MRCANEIFGRKDVLTKLSCAHIKITDTKILITKSMLPVLLFLILLYEKSRTFHTKHFKIGFIQALGFFFYKDLVSRILVLLIDSYRCSKEKDTLRNFSFRAFHEIQYQGHFMKYFYFSIQHSSREGYTVKFFFHDIS